MGQMQEMQAKLKDQLREISVEAEAGDGLVKVTANAAREITNIKVSPDLLDPEDAEGLEDLLMVAINRVLEKAAEREAAESQGLLKNMLPPGMDGLFG